MWVDYHNHTPHCHHALGAMMDYVTQAQRVGLREFGFAEHSPWMMGVASHPLAPSYLEWETYCESVREIQSRLAAAGRTFKVRLGIEMDYSPNLESLARDFISKQPLDYVIGSVHAVVLPDEDPVHTWALMETAPRRYLQHYFEQTKKMLSSGVIDVVGHIDLPKRNGDIQEELYIDLVDSVIDAIRESGATVEVNTSGRDKPVREFFPSPTILRRLVKAGVPVTLGSDAHSPADVGRYFRDAVAMLREFGAHEIMAFTGRKRYGVPI